MTTIIEYSQRLALDIDFICVRLLEVPPLCIRGLRTCLVATPYSIWRLHIQYGGSIL